MKADVYYDDEGKDIREEEIPEDMMELAEKYHTEMIEHVAEQDDELMEKIFVGEELTEDEIKDLPSASPPSTARWFRSAAALPIPQQGRAEAAGRHC